jgi:hypothetical protein
MDLNYNQHGRGNVANCHYLRGENVCFNEAFGLGRERAKTSFSRRRRRNEAPLMESKMGNDQTGRDPSSDPVNSSRGNWELGGEIIYGMPLNECTFGSFLCPNEWFGNLQTSI